MASEHQVPHGDEKKKQKIKDDLCRDSKMEARLRLASRGNDNTSPQWVWRLEQRLMKKSVCCRNTEQDSHTLTSVVKIK